MSGSGDQEKLLPTNLQKRRPNVLCGAYKDDPTFAKFQHAVLSTCEQFDHPPIKAYLLIRLWYTSKTFSTYWKERPTGDLNNRMNLNNRMIWILAHCYVNSAQAKLIMVTWMACPFKVSEKTMQDWESKKFAPEWKRIQPHIQDALAKRNKKRREKRETTRWEDRSRPMTMRWK